MFTNHGGSCFGLQGVKLGAMRLNFSKMHGLGNDFVVFDCVRQTVDLRPEQYRAIADRHLGIGCDQILLVESAQRDDCDFRYRIVNADGGEAEQCGNGARCFGRFVRDQGLSDKPAIQLETISGRIEVRLDSDDQVSVDMGPPILEPADIPFQAEARAASYALEVDGRSLEIGAVSMGNPHAVLLVEDVDSAPVAGLGPAIESHPRFPKRVNAGFMQIVDPSHVRLRVFERGVGETRACGTGACAAVVAGRIQGLLEPQVSVQLPGGELTIGWSGERESVWMTGPATHVFEGYIDI